MNRKHIFGFILGFLVGVLILGIMGVPYFELIRIYWVW